MMKILKGFVFGLIVGIIITSNFVGFAEVLNGVFNSVNIKLNGFQVAKEGDGFTLDNGTTMPYSIIYKGTTYLPLKILSQMLEKEITWESSSRTIDINNRIAGSISTSSTDNLEGAFKGYFKNTSYANVNLFLTGGKQTQVTAEISNIAKTFNDKKDVSTIKEIYKWMSVNLKGIEGEKFGRTSAEIIASRGVTGCTDWGLAFIALSRAKGIPSVFVQTARLDWIKERQEENNGLIVGHILVEVFIENKWYLVDSTSGRLYLDYNKNNFSLSEGYYVFSKSLEVYDSGVLNEQENWNMMMDLFKNFDLTLYSNPKYMYIDLRTGETKQTYDFKANSTVVGNSAQILGSKESVELFDSRFTFEFNNKFLGTYTNTNEQQVYSTQRLIFLITNNDINSIPKYLLNLVPEIKESSQNIILNTVRDGRRVIVIKSNTEVELLTLIKNLPFDFLDKSN